MGNATNFDKRQDRFRLAGILLETKILWQEKIRYIRPFPDRFNDRPPYKPPAILMLFKSAAFLLPVDNWTSRPFLEQH
jgi:hypothetical protein